jgi:hypothetical protein
MRELLESPPWKDALAKCGYQEKELARNWAKAFQLTENEPDMEILRVSKHTWRQLQRLGKGLAERGLVGLLKAQEHGHLHGGGKRARRASIAKRWKVPGAGKRMVPSAISEP